MKDLEPLSAAVFTAAMCLSPSFDNGGDSDRGNAMNLADALACLAFMETGEACRWAQSTNLGKLVAKVLPTLEPVAPKVADRLRAISEALGV